jgi:hypothetical protein
MSRPQTRRRRENNPDSLDKLDMIKQNLLKGLDLFEMVVKRERRKRDMVVSEPGQRDPFRCKLHGFASPQATITETSSVLVG